MEGGCVLWGLRVVVPGKWREKLLHHDHPGISTELYMVAGYR